MKEEREKLKRREDFEKERKRLGKIEKKRLGYLKKKIK